MNINSKIINQYQSDGVVVLRKIISNYWINKLQNGVNINFNKPSKVVSVSDKMWNY